MEKEVFENNIAALKKAQLHLSASSESVRNEALRLIYEELERDKDFIFAENKKDLEEAKGKIGDAVLGRLKFDEKKLKSVRDGILDLIALSDPIGRIEEKRELDSGFILTKKSVPIGVIGMIFEARPDALVQIVALCIKSGNAVILKGGKEAVNSNRALFKVISAALEKTSLTSAFLMLIESHEDVASILKMDKYIDLIIPRGSNAFVRYVMDNTRIPVLGHADGICSIYVDEYANMDIAVPIVLDSKIQYPAACNAVEMVLVNEKIKECFLPQIKKAFNDNGVIIHGDEEVRNTIECESLGEDDLFKEFLSLEVSIKCVKDTAEAIDLINSNGSHHTDAIITEDGNGGFIVDENGTTKHYEKLGSVYKCYETKEEKSEITDVLDTDVENEIAQIKDKNYEIIQEGKNYTITGKDGKTPIVINMIQQEDGTYNMSKNAIYQQEEMNIWIQTAEQNGAKVSDDGEGGYIVEQDGETIYISKGENGFIVPQEQKQGLSSEDIQAQIEVYKLQNVDIVQNGENYTIKEEKDGREVVTQYVKQSNGKYTVIKTTSWVETDAFTNLLSTMIITGDKSSKVVFNNEINGKGFKLALSISNRNA